MGSRAKRCLFGAPDVDVLERERIRLEEMEIERFGRVYGVNLLDLVLQPAAENHSAADVQTPTQAAAEKDENAEPLVTGDENETAQEEHAEDVADHNQPTHQTEPHN